MPDTAAQPQTLPSSATPQADNVRPPARRRARGAQLGNTNALKHGFYSRQFRDAETIDLDTLLREGLQDEITMLRVMMRRTLDLADKTKDLELMTATLGTLGMTATRLAGLLRTQKILGGDDTNTTTAIAQALTELAQELAL